MTARDGRRAGRSLPGRSLAVFSRVLRRPLGLGSAVFLAAVLLASVLARWIAPYGPLNADFMKSLQGPSLQHLLGTDTLGRDVLSRLLYSGGGVFLNIVVAVGVSLVLAVPIGVLVGLVRGRLDGFVTRVADVIMSIPGIVVFLIVLSMFRQSMTAAMVAFGLLAAPGVMRVARAAAIAVNEELYVMAARVAGLTKVQIAMRHVLPRVTGPLLVNMSVLSAQALLLSAGLNFLGLGVIPPAPSWGGLVADASKVMAQQPWLLVPTGGLVTCTVLALVLLGDAIRDAVAEGWSGKPSATMSRRPAERTFVTAIGSGSGTLATSGLVTEDPVVEIERLTVAFPSSERRDGWLPVVQDMTMDIGRHETVGLVGESGCGKTMTGLALLGLLPEGGRVLSGRIRVNGVDTLAMRRSERASLRGATIAFVSQEPMVALDPLFTVGNQLHEAIRTHSGLSGRQAKNRVYELLDMVQIEDPVGVSKLYLHEISGGMAQRVSIALSLVGNPEVLIADEPTTALDVTVQREIIDLLRTVQEETNMAILVISHDWGVIAEMCSRVVVMYAGQAVEYGMISETLNEPLHPYTTGLLRANPRLAVPGSSLPTIVGTVPKPEQWPIGCHFQARCPNATAECSTAPVALEAFGERRFARCLYTGRTRGRKEL